MGRLKTGALFFILNRRLCYCGVGVPLPPPTLAIPIAGSFAEHGHRSRRTCQPPIAALPAAIVWR